MHYYDILIKKVPHALTYQSEIKVEIGSLVSVSLSKRNAHGIVLKQGVKPSFTCENIEEILIPVAVTPLQIKLAAWMSKYYFAPVSKCIALFVPPVIFDAKRQPKLDKNAELVNPDKEHPSKPYHGQALTREQKKVLQRILSASPADRPTPKHTQPGRDDKKNRNDKLPFFLLHGITGSGKTEIYFQLIKKNIQEGKQIVLLVPEIALTSELIRHFAGHFPDQISIIHSKISEGARLQSWHRIFTGKTKLILGSRSALFTPWQNLGAIIMDEEHEWTYKQEQTPRYHTRTVAEKIIELSTLQATTYNLQPSPFLLLGSATPSIETYYRASSPTEPHELHEPSYHLLSLPFRATTEALPNITVVDLREEFKKKNYSMVSNALEEAITDRLLKKEQVILFLNKRGAASCVICRDCGFSPRCKRCDLALTYHMKTASLSFRASQAFAGESRNPFSSLVSHLPGEGLLCHSCGSFEPNILQCPICKSLAIRYVGSGTEKAQLQLEKMFPNARIVRADKDTTSGRHAFEKIYQKMWNREADILLGTQMITKGLDLPKVTLVGILIADIGLHIPDFRASERVFQLLTQVAGRSGRHQPGEVIVQTYQPEHPSIVAAANHDYQGFYKGEIAIREQFFYPPFSKIIKLTYVNKDAKKAEKEAKKMYGFLSSRAELNGVSEGGGVERSLEMTKLDVSPNYIPRIHGKYIWNILIRGNDLKSFFVRLGRTTNDNPLLRVGWKIDVDAQF